MGQTCTMNTCCTKEEILTIKNSGRSLEIQTKKSKHSQQINKEEEKVENKTQKKKSDTVSDLMASSQHSKMSIKQIEKNLPIQIQDANQNPIIQKTVGVGERIKLSVILLPNGAQYEGEWLEGKRDGYGKQSWPDGSIYEGEWKEDKSCGKGKLIHADGDVYDGDWVDDAANGLGTYVHVNGAKYQGEVQVLTHQQVVK
ncbi:unnamed protein product [Paramecium primaurelia]|uniref:MORN repeat protein n=1 Tax=Paramecium primaurelia TaxID=5886 RepID=A0A8S1M9E6_PARPR|nr:unnamed protein product [Paramecium primaurelia]